MNASLIFLEPVSFVLHTRKKNPPKNEVNYNGGVENKFTFQLFPEVALPFLQSPEKKERGGSGINQQCYLHSRIFPSSSFTDQFLQSCLQLPSRTASIFQCCLMRFPSFHVRWPPRMSVPALEKN